MDWDSVNRLCRWLVASSPGFTVLVNGKRCEIVGRVCMDQCMIRLAEEVPVGSVVTLVGKRWQ